jgi:hypothetical protein
VAKKYIDTNVLEEWWAGWLITGDKYTWDRLSGMIYKMSFGIACHFNPSNEEEHQDYAHETFLQTMEKIKLGKLKFIPGKAPVFNLLTTTIMRQLYSKMNKETRRKKHMTKYAVRVWEVKNPDMLKDLGHEVRDFELV